MVRTVTVRYSASWRCVRPACRRASAMRAPIEARSSATMRTGIHEESFAFHAPSLRPTMGRARPPSLAGEGTPHMSSLPFTLEVQPLEGHAGFRLVGELDVATAPLLRDALADFESEDGLVLELEELTFIDSSGWNTLMAYLRGTDQRLVLVDPTPAVIRTLALVGLEKHPRIAIRSSGR